MKTLLNTFLLMVGMLALIAVHKAWRDYGENMKAYRDGNYDFFISTYKFPAGKYMIFWREGKGYILEEARP